jgi:hypothetical protein
MYNSIHSKNHIFQRITQFVATDISYNTFYAKLKYTCNANNPIPVIESTYIC